MIKKQMILFNGQIITSKKDYKNEVIKFEQLNVDLTNLSTSTIKKPKLQETSTLKLLSCFVRLEKKLFICKSEAKKEILPILIRRIALPFYIPVIALICSLLLLKNHKKFSKRISVFFLGFTILILTELIIRFTGLNSLLRLGYIVSPFILLTLIYSFLIYKFNTETKTS